MTRSWTVTCRWGRCGAAGPGTARSAWPSGTAGGCWPGGWAGSSPAPPTASCCVTPARPAGRRPASGPAAPGSTRPAAAPAPSSGTSTAARTCARQPLGRLAPGHPVLAAQHWTGALLALDDTRPAGHGAARSATWASSHPGCCARHRRASSPASAGRRWPPGANGTSSHRARRQPSRFPPASAALTAALAATAMTVLTGSDEQAIEQIRALLPRPGRPAAAPARRAARPALAAAIAAGPRPVPARPGPRPEPRRPDPLPHRHAPGGHPGRPARAARRPRPGDPAAAMAGVGDPADARPRVRARPVPQRHRRVPAAARPSRPRHQHGHHRPARLPQRPGRRRGAAGAGRRRPRHRAHRDQLPGRLPRHQRQPHRLPAPPRPHPRRDDHRQRSGASCATAPPRTPARHRRHRDAQRYLFQLLTGADLHDPRHALAFTSSNDYGHYQAFADALPTGLRGRAARPRRRPPARPGHRRAADLGPAARLLRRPEPARARTRTTSTWTPPAASSSPRSSPSPRPPRGWAPPPATSGSRSTTSPGPHGNGAGPPRPRHGNGGSMPAPS